MQKCRISCDTLLWHWLDDLAHVFRGKKEKPMAWKEAFRKAKKNLGRRRDPHNRRFTVLTVPSKA